jgi:hypothetical protein
MLPKVSVQLALVAAKPPLRALADVTLRLEDSQITIRRCAVFEKPGQPPWANFPRLLIEKNGKKQFAPLFEISRTLKERVLSSILDEYRRTADES